jgi:hypothetical protein
VATLLLVLLLVLLDCCQVINRLALGNGRLERHHVDRNHRRLGLGRPTTRLRRTQRQLGLGRSTARLGRTRVRLGLGRSTTTLGRTRRRLGLGRSTAALGGIDGGVVGGGVVGIVVGVVVSDKGGGDGRKVGSGTNGRKDTSKGGSGCSSRNDNSASISSSISNGSSGSIGVVGRLAKLLGRREIVRLVGIELNISSQHILHIAIESLGRLVKAGIVGLRPCERLPAPPCRVPVREVEYAEIPYLSKP